MTNSREGRAGPCSPAGSTLIEVLVAMLVLVTGVLAMAQLFLIAAASNAASRDTTMTATLAAQKVEELLSSDVGDAAELVEHVDAWGRVVSTDDGPPPQAVYTRRWSVESVAAETVRIRVRVGRSDRSGSSTMPAETRVLTITRKRS
jgi:type IV pilus modification protein PilV